MRRRSSMSSTSLQTSPPTSTDRIREHGAFANVIGLAADMQTLGSKGNLDGYELFLCQLLDNSLSVPTAGIVRIGFETVDNAEVCIVTVASSGKPVFARPHEGGTGPTEFWVRTGNAAKQRHGDDMLEYQTNHWGS